MSTVEAQPQLAGSSPTTHSPEHLDQGVGTKRKRGLGGVTTRLALSIASATVVGVITGPLQARALGPAGRGELAAIMTPFLFLPTLASVGLGSYATRAVAIGKRPGQALGSLLPVALAIGVVIAATSPVIAGLLAGGRAVVYTMLIIGLVAFPVSMFTGMLLDVSIGLEDWGPVTAVKLMPAVVQLVGIPLLFVTNNLTVTSAAIVTYVGNSLFLIPTIRIFREALPLEFDLSELRRGVSYGAKCWLGGISNLANARLDQLLMIRLVSSSVLGEYSVGVVVAGFFVSPVAAAISATANARFARDGADLTRRLCRMVLFGTAVTCVCVGVITPVAIHYVYGPAFDAAVPMTLILLLGTVPNAAGGILNTSVSAHGNPGKPARAEGLALIITVGGLAVMLPILGGIGAAIVSVVAYTAQFAYMLVAAKRLHGGAYRDYLVPSHYDLQILRSMITAQWHRTLRWRPLAGRS